MRSTSSSPTARQMPVHSSANQKAQTTRCVFVYGTLRRGDVRDINRLLPTPHFIGTGQVAGRLYHLGRYPGIVLGGEALVVGEVYAISAELERLLDEIEEVWPEPTGEYTKREVRVRVTTTTGEADELSCLLYEITAERTKGKLLIESGDWVAHVARHPVS